MAKEHPEMDKSNVENAAKTLNEPVGLGGKNPHTISPPPPLPNYTLVQAAKKRSLRLSMEPNLQPVSVRDLLGAKVIITGKKGKVLKVSGNIKPK